MKVDFVNRDREFIEKAKSVSQLAQYQLYQNYAKAMFNISYRILKNREEAEDTLQEAFTDVFRKLDTFRFESSFGSWLKAVVINKCINKLKKAKLDFFLAEDVEDYDTWDEKGVNDEDIQYEVNQVRRAIEELPDGYRLVFSLYSLEGYDHDEISQILDISVSTSKTQFMRAKNRIKELLKEYHNAG